MTADASRQSRVRREQLQEVAQISRTVKEYLAELEQVNPVSDAEMVSTTDPDAVLATKGGGTISFPKASPATSLPIGRCAVA